MAKNAKTVSNGKVKGQSARAREKDDRYMNADYYKQKHEGLKPIFHYDEALSGQSSTVRIFNPGDNIPILVGIYKDDFHIGIQNQWQTGGSSMMKMIVDTAAGFITGRDAKMTLKAAGAALDWIGEDAQEPWVKNLVASGKELVSKGESLANSHIFSADDYFKAFKGTSVTFPTNLSVTIMTDSYEGAPDYKDVYDTVKRLLSISIGDFNSYFAGFVGVQSPPNNFASSFANIGDSIKGAVKIVFGDPGRGGYIIDNMVISNVSFVFSKIMVQVTPPPKVASTTTTDRNKDGKFRPLFVDIQVMFEPARMMTLNDIHRALNI